MTFLLKVKILKIGSESPKTLNGRKNLVTFCVHNTQLLCKILPESVHNFLSYPLDKPTNKQADPITKLL